MKVKIWKIHLLSEEKWARVHQSLRQETRERATPPVGQA